MANEKQAKSGNWFQRHKVLTVFGALIVLGILISAVSPKSSNTETTTNTPAASSNGATTTNTPVVPTEKMTISNTSYSAGSYGTGSVLGEILNNDTVKHSATLKATFYDAAGKIIGTASGAITGVEPGQTKTFELITTDDVAAHATMKVAVDTLL